MTPPSHILPILLVAVAFLGGCVEHQVVVRHDASRQLATSALTGARLATRLHDDVPVSPPISAVVEDRHHTAWEGVSIRKDPLPIDLAISMWSLHPDDTLKRGDVIAASPRPWWQRFPMDAVTDLMIPRTFYAIEDSSVRVQPVIPLTVDELNHRAVTFGYATAIDAPTDTKEDRE